jgi:RNA polymerase sigma-70 factor, ECF subfamily
LCFIIGEHALIATFTRAEATVYPESFERIFREHSAFVYRTAYRVTGRVEDAEDVLQTLFVRLLRRDLPLEFEKNPKAYLYRAAVNTSLNVIRSRRRSVLSDDLDELESHSSGTERAGESAVEERLRAAIAELKPRAAEILVLRHVHGYTDAEIAKLLGTSRGTIAVSLFRTRARLRKTITAYLGDKS